LHIGPSTNSDALIFIGNGTNADPGGSWSFTVPVDVDAALTATTVDADTDFTVGGTVITDNTITDDGTLIISTATATQFRHSTAATDALVEVGQNDVQRGVVKIYGDATGDDSGGAIQLNTAADNDGTGMRFN
jgi:hypothetical protein